MSVIEQVAVLCCKLHVELPVRHAHDETFNRVADALSHIRIEVARKWASTDFALPLALL